MTNNFNFDEFIKTYTESSETGRPQMLSRDDARIPFYEYVCNRLVGLNRPILVVETGAMWSTQGAFTLVFADLIKNHTGGKIVTIDISEEHLNKAKENTKDFSDVIEYILSDSVEYLSSLTKETMSDIDLLYLDSFDLDALDPLPSEIHHLRELLAVYNHLRQDSIIGVDDNLMPGNWMEWRFPDGQVTTVEATNKIIGKGTLTDRYLRDLNWTRFNDDKSYCLLGYIRK